MNDKYKFLVDCLDVDFKGITLCDQKVHGKDICIQLNMSAYVTKEEFIRFVKNLNSLQGDQFANITIEKLKEE